MIRYLETIAVLVGFAVFTAALLGDGRDGPILGLLLGVAIMDAPRWLPCILARLAKLRRPKGRKEPEYTGRVWHN